MKKWASPLLVAITVGVVLIAAGESVAVELSEGILIRGIGNARTCSADTVVPENDRYDGLAHNLSVNCTDQTSDINKYNLYIGGMVHTKFCVARITAVKRLAGSASVKTDPVPGNDLHCLLNNVKPKALVGIMTTKP